MAILSIFRRHVTPKQLLQCAILMAAIMFTLSFAHAINLALPFKSGLNGIMKPVISPAGYQNASPDQSAATRSPTMIRAYYLSKGQDGNSHVLKGHLAPDFKIATETMQFKISPPHSTLDWHNDPEPQYVLFLAGALEFTTKTGAPFTVQPGEVLIAADNTGTGHKWRIVNEQPWIRAYVVYKPGANLHFVADKNQ